MIINHNLSSINVNRLMLKKNEDVSDNMRKLSSGMRIDRAGDDASGLAVSEKMRAQIRGLRTAERNAQDGISFIQTAEGYLSETTSILQRLRELSIQSSNGIYTAEDRMQIQVEADQLLDEINRIAEQSEFNGLTLLMGRFARPSVEAGKTDSMWFHIGANMDQKIEIYVGKMDAIALGLSGEVERNRLLIDSPDRANQAIGRLDEALKKVNKQRADLGAYQTRLEYISSGALIGAENLQASESRIRDVNMAEEMSDLVRNQVLLQAQTSMLAHANIQAQSLLRLLE